MLNWNKFSTKSIKKRKSVEVFSDCYEIENLEGSLNELFFGTKGKGEQLRALINAIYDARERHRPIIFMMGAHLVKLGLAPLVIELVKRGFITHIATNGAGSIHDFELGLYGVTSENVKENIRDGSFGMVRETPRDYICALLNSSMRQKTIGQSLGLYIQEWHKTHIKTKPYLSEVRKYSLLLASYEYKIPMTIHMALGTDIIHQHFVFWNNIEVIVKGLANDFEVFVENVCNLENGVVINFGSAVLLPEVFLKAVSMARNLGNKLENFTAANFDMIQHYRSNENVVLRPGGKGYSFTGHHEIMLPLLTKLLVERDQ